MLFWASRDLVSLFVKKTFSSGHIINPLMTKPVWSRWLGINFFRIHEDAVISIHPTILTEQARIIYNAG